MSSEGYHPRLHLRQSESACPPARLTEIYQCFLTDDAKLAALLAARSPIVSFHFGVSSRDRIEALRVAGIVLLATATNLKEGKLISAAGIDAVVAQMYEAGGHRGVFDPDGADDRLGTVALSRLQVRTLDIPVIAAGGIMDGARVAASLTLGASAAQPGTTFIACPKSGYRAALLGPPAGTYRDDGCDLGPPRPLPRQPLYSLG